MRTSSLTFYPISAANAGNTHFSRWENLGNIRSSDDNHTVAYLATNWEKSKKLRVRYDFDNSGPWNGSNPPSGPGLPRGAAVVGIEVKPEWHDANEVSKDDIVRWHDGANYQGVNRANGTNLPKEDGTTTYGKPDDDWGIADIDWHNHELTLEFQVQRRNGAVGQPSIDVVPVALHYRGPSDSSKRV